MTLSAIPDQTRSHQPSVRNMALIPHLLSACTSRHVRRRLGLPPHLRNGHGTPPHSYVLCSRSQTERDSALNAPLITVSSSVSFACPGRHAAFSLRAALLNALSLPPALESTPTSNLYCLDRIVLPCSPVPAPRTPLPGPATVHEEPTKPTTGLPFCRVHASKPFASKWR